jgi:teichuronic acid biosynthesis glycosyltransferase TuaG
LDADDYWKKEKLETQINFMKNQNFDISHTSYDVIDEELKFIRKRKAKTFSNYRDILTSCDIGLSTVILDKKILSKKIQFMNLKTKEDFVLWLTILKENMAIGGLDQSLSFWRKTKNSLSSSVSQKLVDGFRVYYKYLEFSFMKSCYLLICLSLNYLKKN